MANDDKIVCWCSSVTSGTIRQAIRDGARNIDDIRRMTGACTVGRCKEFSPTGSCCCNEIMQIIKEDVTC